MNGNHDNNENEIDSLNLLRKIKNFKNNPKKLNYAYILTPRGIIKKTTLTLNFMNRKIQEYEELKSEIENDRNK